MKTILSIDSIYFDTLSCLGLSGCKMGVESSLGKCVEIASTSSLIHLTQWRANWTWWRIRSSGSYGWGGSAMGLCLDWCLINTLSVVLVWSGSGQWVGSHCTKGFLRKPVQKCTPSAVLQLSQCSLAIRPVLWLGPLCRHHPWVTQVCVYTFRLELSLTYDTQKPLLFPGFLSSWIFNLISYVS